MQSEESLVNQVCNATRPGRSRARAQPIQISLVQSATDAVKTRLPDGVDADKVQEVAEQGLRAVSTPAPESVARVNVERAGMAAANEGVGSFELQRLARKASQAAAGDAPLEKKSE